MDFLLHFVSLSFNLPMVNVTLTLTMPIKGRFIFCWLVLATIHLRTKFEVSSFIHSRHRTVSEIFKKWVM